MSFTNIYYKRTAATQKACFVCDRPTATVLATKDSVDFFYACDVHLDDPGFAFFLGENGDSASDVRKPILSDEEIQKVKEEYEEKQRKRKEKEKEKENETTTTSTKIDVKDEEKDRGKEKEKEKEKENKSTVLLPSQSLSPTHVHQRYSLHREIYAMRQGVHRRRRQAAQAKEVAPRLPSAPRSTMPVRKPLS
ncbi:hypothetical protein EW145_g765 [Phellinidium pouzarii]|uniref:DUF1742-domain-containing protein n=1 Tax=Phellinidium pouzarii TaxID=167371 RepID=A0A4S4LH15_9AGAM|nr:hypothetical protein EW145_g765 [Phellinidium pouzarii]